VEREGAGQGKGHAKCVNTQHFELKTTRLSKNYGMVTVRSWLLFGGFSVVLLLALHFEIRTPKSRTVHVAITSSTPPTRLTNTTAPELPHSAHREQASPQAGRETRSKLSQLQQREKTSFQPNFPPVLPSQNISMEGRLGGFTVKNKRRCVAMSLFTEDKNHVKRYGAAVPKAIASVGKVLGPGWEVFVYFDDSVTTTLKNDINNNANSSGVKVNWFHMPRNHVRSGAFWRYFAFDECFVTIMRDAEFAFESNDVWAYNHFMSMPHEFSYVCLAHARSWIANRPVLGGTYMFKNVDRRLNMTQLMYEWPWWHNYGSDEIFLANMVHPKRPSIVYYEPRKKIIDSVKLDGMARFETYVQLPSCYKSVGKC